MPCLFIFVYCVFDTAWLWGTVTRSYPAALRDYYVMHRITAAHSDRDGRNHCGPLRRIDAFDVTTAVTAESTVLGRGVDNLFQRVFPYCLYVIPRNIARAIQTERPSRTVGYRDNIS